MTRTAKVATNAVPLTEGALDAPILYFDGAPMAGVGQGLGRIALEAVIQDLDAEGRPTIRRRVVAHLRGTPEAFASLRGAISSMEAVRTPAADPSQVN